VRPLDIVEAACNVFWADYCDAFLASKLGMEPGLEFLANLSDLEFLGAGFFAMGASSGQMTNQTDHDDMTLVKLFDEGLRYRRSLKKLKSSFAAAKLKLPSLPVSLTRKLKQHSDFSWSSRHDHEALSDYFLKFQWPQPPNEGNLLSISWEGHGVNSYALAVNMKIGPIHVLLKNYMGGWYGDRSQENEKWNTLVDSMEPLFSELSRPHFSHTEESTKIWIHNQELFEYVDGVYTLESFKSFDEAMRYALARISA
jgi:hypothetical protein